MRFAEFIGILAALCIASGIAYRSDDDSTEYALSAGNLAPLQVINWEDHSTTLAVVFVHEKGQKSDFMRAVADLASIEAASAGVAVSVGTVDVHEYPDAMHRFGLKEVPAVHIYPSGLGAKFPIVVPYADPLPAQHYVDRIMRLHSLASDSNGDCDDIVDVIADVMHASDYEGTNYIDIHASGAANATDAAQQTESPPKRFSSASLADAGVTLVEGRIKGLQARIRRMEVLRAALKLIKEAGPGSLASEVSERQQAMLSSGTYASQANSEQRDMLLLETAILRRAMQAALDPSSPQRLAAAARAQRVAADLPAEYEMGDMVNET